MRPTYSFSEGVVAAITHDRYQHPDPRVQEGMEILWLKSRNEPHGRVAELANVSRSTVQRTLRIYVAKGLNGIRSFGWKGQPSALTPHRATIEEDFYYQPVEVINDGVCERSCFVWPRSFPGTAIRSLGVKSSRATECGSCGRDLVRQAFRPVSETRVIFLVRASTGYPTWQSVWE